MEVRFSPDRISYKKLTTEELRSAFLIDDLFLPDNIKLVYSDVDRVIIGSAVPVAAELKLEASRKEMAADYFAERREIGIINIGSNGTIVCDDTEYRMEHKDALYIGRGTRSIIFKSDDFKNPAQFYIISYPSHKEYPTAHAKFKDAELQKLGTAKEANKRTIYKYIHVNRIKSSQLVMGMTELEEGSVWNTMPVHTHQRRTEIYLYFNLSKKDALVFHMMGEPDETRHIVVRNRQAVISPAWSIHAGAATQNYTFIWAMGGENQDFNDMDVVPMDKIK